MAITISANPSEIREIAKALRQNCNDMDDKTKRMAAEFLAFDATYHDPDSLGIRDECANILTEIKKLSPQIESIGKLLEAYATRLES